MPHHDDCSPVGEKLRRHASKMSLDCNPHKEGPLLDRRTHDPWKHRASEMRCKTCMWFVPKKKTDREQGQGYDLGRCRKHAPTMSGFPAVFVNDWCGDHKIDEDKI